MPNALPLGPGTRTFTAPAGLVMYNGNVLGYMENVSGEETIMYEAITGIGQAATLENVVVGYRVSVNVNIFRTVARGNVSTPDSPGSLKQQGIFPLFKQILFVEGVDLILLDQRNGKTLELIHTAKAAGRNWNMSSRSSMRQAVSFVAIRSSDESEIGTVLQQSAA